MRNPKLVCPTHEGIFPCIWRLLPLKHIWTYTTGDFDLNPAVRQPQKQTEPLPDDTALQLDSTAVTHSCFSASKHSKNAGKYKAKTAGNECQCRHRDSSGERNNKFSQQDQMAGWMGFKQPVSECVCEKERESERHRKGMYSSLHDVEFWMLYAQKNMGI